MVANSGADRGIPAGLGEVTPQRNAAPDYKPAIIAAQLGLEPGTGAEPARWLGRTPSRNRRPVKLFQQIAQEADMLKHVMAIAAVSTLALTSALAQTSTSPSTS